MSGDFFSSLSGLTERKFMQNFTTFYVGITLDMLAFITSVGLHIL